MTNLEKYLYQLRRIEEHREAASEKEIRKIYKNLLKELKAYLADIYISYSEDDMLTYAGLARVGMDARFLEEVEQRISGITPQVANEINNTVSLTYEACYDGMVNAVNNVAGDREVLKKAFSTVSAVTPDVIKRAVNNPVSGLTLKDTLEKHRKDIIYDIKKNIGVGLSNGDRFSTMAKRISESLDGDYTKSIRIVRTEAHRVRESGFNDAATDINEALKNGKSGYVMAKTWHTMKDSRVRPAKQKRAKYNHIKMEGVTIPQDELFELPSGATCKAPSQTGVAGEDINCRCYLSYDLVLASELTKVQDGKKTIEEAVNAKTIEDCKTVEDVEQLFRDKDWFLHDEINGKEWRSDEYLSLKGCDLESAKLIYEGHEKVFNKYPQLKGKLAAVKSNNRMDGRTYAQCNMGFGCGGIEINPSKFKSIENVTKTYTEDLEQGFHPAGTTHKSIIIHELGHAIDDYLSNTLHYNGVTPRGKRGYVSDKLRAKVLKKAGINTALIEQELSGYATKNAHEFWAECFSEYMESENPRKVAKAFGEILEEIMKEV